MGAFGHMAAIRPFHHDSLTATHHDPSHFVMNETHPITAPTPPIDCNEIPANLPRS